jgi:hypothetical protein
LIATPERSGRPAGDLVTRSGPRSPRWTELAETFAADVLLAVFVATISVVWAFELGEHAGVLRRAGISFDPLTRDRLLSADLLSSKKLPRDHPSLIHREGSVASARIP